MLDDCTIEIRKHILISARHNRDGPIIGPSVYSDHPTMCVRVCIHTYHGTRISNQIRRLRTKIRSKWQR